MSDAPATAAQTQNMLDASVHVDRAGQLLAGIRGNVQRAIDATGAGYQSDAADRFRATMHAWDGDFAKIIQGLEDIRVALTHTARKYEATMAADDASVNQIAALLNGDADI
jgi:WXG100 family type VII secretion target